MRRWAPPLIIICACLATMAPSCGSLKGTHIDAATHGLEGNILVEENAGVVTGRYRYDGKAGPANVIGDLQRKPPGGKWSDEGSPSTKSSDGQPVEGRTHAHAGRGKWRIRITLTNRDTGALIGHWDSPTRWVSHS